jgi:O-antigen/teichoic acid export membrane protein
MMPLKALFSKIKIGTPRIYKDTIVVFAGNLLTAIAGFLFIVIVSRKLGPEQFGIFSVALAVLTLASDISDFGVNTSMIKFAASHFAKKDFKTVDEIIGLNFRFKVLTGVIIAVAGFFLSPLLSKLLAGNHSLDLPLRLAFTGVLAILAFGFLMAVLQIYYRFLERTLWSAAMAVLRIALILCLIIAVHMNLVSTLIAYITVPFLLFFPVVRRVPCGFLKASWKTPVAKEIFDFNKWLVISNISFIISSRLDIFLLTKLSGMNAVGLYSSATKLAALITLFNASFAITFLPKLSGLNDVGKIKQYLRKNIPVFLVIMVCLVPIIFIAPHLIKLFFGKEYIGSSGIFQIVAIGYIIDILVSLGVLTLYALKRSDIQAIIMLVGLVLSFAGNWLLIPLMGAKGSALTFLSIKVFSLVFLVIFLLIFFEKNVKLKRAITQSV